MSALTSALPAVVQLTESIPHDSVYRLTVAQYHEMIDKDILTEDDPVELLEGWLITKMSKNPPHILVVGLTREALGKLVQGNWFVDSQEPITTEKSEPEPDVSVVKGNRRDFAERHPYPKEVGMLVEVSDASLKRDRTTKKRIYAAAQIAIYWIINLVEAQIEVYTKPSGPTAKPDFAHRQDYKRGDTIPVILEGKEVGRIVVDDLLP